MTAFQTSISRRALLALGAMSSTLAQAANWPEQPVTLVVPYAPGGNTDAMARVAAEALTQQLGHPFIVENRGGAGGTIGADYVAKAKPDGYTLLFGTISQVSTAPYTNRIKYDPQRDFVPISNVGGNPFVISARSNAPFNSIAELIAYSKANPGRLTVGNSGIGGMTHLSAALFLNKAGITATMVSYRGAAPALTDVLSGNIDFYSGSLSEVIPYAQSDKLKLLGVSSLQRAPQLPHVPAISETFPGYQVETWNGILGPSAMPSSAVNTLIAAMKKVHADLTFQQKLIGLGITPIPQFGDAFRRRIAADMDMWKPIIKTAGIVPE